MSFIPSNLYFRLHQQSTIVSPIHVTLAGRFSSIGTCQTVVSCRCMLEEETVCRLVIAQNEKRYVSKVFLNKDSRNPKMFLLQQGDFHKHVRWSRLQSSPCSCARGFFIPFCLHHGFFWECEVLLCLQFFKNTLFAKIFCLQCVSIFFLVCAMTFSLQCGNLFCLQCARFILFSEWDCF